MKITDVSLTLFAWESIPFDNLRPSYGPADRQERSRAFGDHDR
jgi:hypothetical protein